MSAGWKKSRAQSKHDNWGRWPYWPTQQQPEVLLRRNFRSRRAWDNINSRRQPAPPQGHKKTFKKLSPSLSHIPTSHSFLTFERFCYSIVLNSGLLGQKKLILNCAYLGGWLRISVVLHSTATTITGKICMRNELNQFDGEIKHFPVKRRTFDVNGLFHQKNWLEHKWWNEFQCIFLAMCDVQQHLGVAMGVTDPTTESPLGCVFCL